MGAQASWNFPWDHETTAYEHVIRQSTDHVPTDSDDPPLQDDRARPKLEEQYDQPQRAGQSATWRPFWLQLGALASFSGLFLAFTVVLPSLLAFSERNDGIAEARENLVYVWRFGPTAILTVVSILWARVEFQIQRYKIWTDMESGRSLSVDDYHLDYTQLLLPTVLLSSLRRKHYTVLFATLASVILKVQIVLSPSLFEPSLVQTTEPVTLNALDSFDVAENITDSSRLSYYFARSLQNFDLEPPFGVDVKCAYQTFSWPDKDGNGIRGTVDSPVKAVVDAVFANMTCLHLESHDSSWENRNNSYGVEMQETDIELRFEKCDETVTVHESTRASQQNAARRADDRTVSRTAVDNLYGRPCSSLPQQQPQLVYYSGACNPGASEDDLSPSEECAAVLCSPMAWVSKVEVIDDGNEQKVSLHPNQDGYPIDVRTNLWDMLLRSIPGEYRGARPPVDAAFVFRGLDIDEEGFLATNDGLEQALVNLTDGLAPMVAHHALRRTDESQIDGWRTTTTERLQMNRAICFAMMSLFAVCACIALWTLLRSRRVLRAWHRDPATILGTMLFFHIESPAGVSCKNTLSNTRERDEAQWSGSSFTPLALRPWLWIITVLYMLGLITALVVTLRISQTSDGIATVNEERYSSLLWKSVPTLAVLLVAMFVSSSDAAVRGLITLASMSEKPCHAWQLDLSLLDMLGLHSLYLSIKMRLPAIGLTQGLTVLCSFLAALSSVLFTSEFSPELTEAHFEQSSWFGGSNPQYNPNDDVRGEVLGAIGLTSGTGNLTYPPGTYADLLFPSLALGSEALRDAASIEVKTPAARMDHTCVELFNGTEITVDMLPATSQRDNQTVRFAEQMNCPPRARSDTAYTLADVTPDSPYFGLVLKYHLCETGPGAGGRTAVDIGENGLWWTRSYAWGKVSDSGNGSLAVDYFSAWRCNFTWAEVDTTLNLIPTSGDFRIDHSHAPAPDESTTRPYDPLFPVPVFVQDFQKAELHKTMFPAGINTDPRVQEFSDQISLLMEPVGSLGFQDLEREDRKDFVLETINANTRLAMAQIANFEHRLGTNETSQTEPFEHGDLSPVSGVVSRQRRRLFQNAAVTYILIAILSAAVLVNTWALISSALVRYGKSGGISRQWLLDLELKGVAPDGYSSVAMMGALVSGSNYHDSMPDNAHLMLPDQLLRHLADRRFQMGWFINNSTNEKVFTIGAVEDESKSELEVEGRNQQTGTVQDRLLSTTYDNAGQ